MNEATNNKAYTYFAQSDGLIWLKSLEHIDLSLFS